MQNIVKKLAKPILGLLFVLSLCLIAPQEVKAGGPTKMTLGENGVIKWESESENTALLGWKFYTKYWQFTVKQTINGIPRSQNVEVYYSEDNTQGYTQNTQTTTIGGNITYLFT